jgi:hypothetical protein
VCAFARRHEFVETQRFTYEGVSMIVFERELSYA